MDSLARNAVISSRFEPKTRPIDDQMLASASLSHVFRTSSMTSWQSRTSSLESARSYGSARVQNPPMLLCRLQNLGELPITKHKKKTPARKRTTKSWKTPGKRKPVPDKRKQYSVKKKKAKSTPNNSLARSVMYDSSSSLSS
eukprot:scaffold29351_cov52-Attheya_sp.AAC.5